MVWPVASTCVMMGLSEWSANFASIKSPGYPPCVHPPTVVWTAMSSVPMPCKESRAMHQQSDWVGPRQCY